MQGFGCHGAELFGALVLGQIFRHLLSHCEVLTVSFRGTGNMFAVINSSVSVRELGVVLAVVWSLMS